MGVEEREREEGILKWTGCMHEMESRISIADSP